MNTDKSDQFVNVWRNSTNPLKRGSVTFQRTFNTSPETLFSLLCPTTEYDWIPNWKCELLHSNSGYAEYNAVFRTEFFGPQEIWVCTRYEPPAGLAYSRVSDDFSCIIVADLAGNHDGTVTVTWVVTVSALTPTGNTAVADIQSARAHLAEIFDGLDDYLNNGKMTA